MDTVAPGDTQTPSPEKNAVRSVSWLSALGASILSALLFTVPQLLAAAIPALAVPFTAASLLSALPIVLSRLGHSILQPLIAAVGGAVLAAAFTGDLGSAVGFLLMSGVWAIVASEVLARKRSLIAMGASGLLVLSVIALTVALVGGREGVTKALTSPDADRAFARWATNSGLTASEAATQIANIRGIVENIFPGLAVVFAAVIVLVNTLAAGRVLRRRARGFVPEGELTRLEWPFSIVFAFVVTGLLVVVPSLKPIAWNSILVTSFLFAIQGLSIVSFGLVRFLPSEFGRMMVVLALVIGPWNFCLSLLGLFDQWFDFRRLHAPRDTPASQV